MEPTEPNIVTGPDGEPLEQQPEQPAEQPVEQPAEQPVEPPSSAEVKTEPAAEVAPVAAQLIANEERRISGLSVEVHREPQNGRYVFGVVLGGAFVAFADRKLGGVDDELREAANPGHRAERAERYLRDVLGR